MSGEERVWTIGLRIVLAVMLATAGAEMVGYLAGIIFGNGSGVVTPAKFAGAALGLWAFYKTWMEKRR